MNVVDKYFWIQGHPAFLSKAGEGLELEITPHLVHPKHRRVMDYEPLNTHMELWCEGLHKEYIDGNIEYCHDWELDCGGDSWEQVIENLYEKVKNKHGEYTDKDYDDKFNSLYPAYANTGNLFSTVFDKKIREENESYNLSQDMLIPNKNNSNDIEWRIDRLESDLDEDIKYLDALEEYLLTCPESNISEVKVLIEQVKMRIVLIKKSLEMKCDVLCI